MEGTSTLLPILPLLSLSPLISHTNTCECNYSKVHDHSCLYLQLSPRAAAIIDSLTRGNLCPACLIHITLHSNEHNPPNASLKAFCSVILCVHNAAIKQLQQRLPSYHREQSSAAILPNKQQQRLLVF